MKVPSRYTYVCQPADVSWIKPFKGRMRSKWVAHLRDRLTHYNDGASEREEIREALEAEISSIRAEATQKDAAEQVAALTAQPTSDAFKMKAPSRVDIATWIAASWKEIGKGTFVNGFGKANLLLDIRPVDAEDDEDGDAGDLVNDLSELNLTSDELCSDDDVRSGSDEE